MRLYHHAIIREVRHQRSVHPLVTAAVVSYANRHRVSIGGHDDVRRSVASGAPTVEKRHTSFLAALLQHGGPWSAFDAGLELGRNGAHPYVQFLQASRDPQELWQRSLRLEPLLHLGNRARTEPLGNSFQVQHEPRLGSSPALAESMFVAGAQCGLLLRVGVRRAQATLRAGAKTLCAWPRSQRVDYQQIGSGWRVVDGWTIIWKSAPIRETPASLTGSPVNYSERTRALVADGPEAQWTLANLANSMGVSRRTLQRRVEEEGATVKRLIVRGRLDAGVALVTRTDLPLTLIAVGCGFADGAHFANSCRRFSGASPSELRREAS